jgi:hypothetical protein
MDAHSLPDSRATHLRTHPFPELRTTNRTRFIEHRGKRVLLLDYTGLGDDPAELQAEIERTKAVISAEPPGTVLTLTDVRGARITPANVRAMKELVQHNVPYVRWSAVVVGLSGVYLTAFRAIQALSRRRNLRSFGDPDEAKEWLVTQP